jgi:hypothetical protein
MGDALPCLGGDPDAAEAACGQVVLPREGNHWVHVARVFGRMVAQGSEDFDAALAAMRRAAAVRAPGMDASGRDMRMAHLLHDAVGRWGMVRDRTRFAIRRALGPLLAERRPSAELLRVALAVNVEAGTPLLRDEVIGELRREVYWAARRAEPKGKGRRG